MVAYKSYYNYKQFIVKPLGANKNNEMFSILNQYYPPPEIEKRNVLVAVLFGTFIGFFLIFFQPFDINLSNYENKNLKIFFFGVISTCVLLIFFILLPYLFPRMFSVRIWKVVHQILYYLMALLVIATFNGLYINYLENLSFNWSNYWWIIMRTTILGGIPICFLVLLDYNRKMKIHLREAKELLGNGLKDVEALDKAKFHVSTHSKNDSFVIDVNSFLFAEAQGNYIFINSLEDKEKNKSLHRISLTLLEKQLNDNHLKRCHRSYLVNLRKVRNITGNAQGLKLWFENYDYEIPVSRKYIPIIKNYFSKD